MPVILRLNFRPVAGLVFYYIMSYVKRLALNVPTTRSRHPLATIPETMGHNNDKCLRNAE